MYAANDVVVVTLLTPDSIGSADPQVSYASASSSPSAVTGKVHRDDIPSRSRRFEGHVSRRIRCGWSLRDRMAVSGADS